MVLAKPTTKLIKTIPAVVAAVIKRGNMIECSRKNAVT